jgi:hypothetical protein
MCSASAAASSLVVTAPMTSVELLWPNVGVGSLVGQ